MEATKNLSHLIVKLVVSYAWKCVQYIYLAGHWTVKEAVAFKLEPYSLDIIIINIIFIIKYCDITF
jgi:hypothetical protein